MDADICRGNLPIGFTVLPGLAPVDPVFPLCNAPLPDPGSGDPDPDPPLARVPVPLGPKALLPGD
jgi:hypothetical protein